MVEHIRRVYLRYVRLNRTKTTKTEALVIVLKLVAFTDVRVWSNAHTYIAAIQYLISKQMCIARRTIIIEIVR